MRTRAFLGTALLGAAAALGGCTVDPQRWSTGGSVDMSASVADMTGTSTPDQATPDIATPPGPDMATPDMATPDMLSPPAAITGTYNIVQHLPTATDNGVTQNVPRDLSGLPIQVFPIDNTNTYKAAINGTGAANGTFTIDGLPDGARYALRVSNRWIAGTTARTHTITDDTLGRSTGARLTAASVTLTANLTSLAPAAFSDNYAVFSPTLDTSFNDLIAGAGGNFPNDGDTAVSGLTFELKVMRPAALRFNTDAVFLTQLTQDLNSPITYLRVPRVLVAPSFTVADAANAGTLAGAMTTVALNQTIASLDWQRAVFNTATKAMHPTQAPLIRMVFGVMATPGGFVRREWPWTPSLLEATAKDDLGNFDVTSGPTGVLTYGNAYPAAWSQIGFAEAAVDYKRANNSDGSIKGVGSIVYLADLATFKGRAIAPLVTPVRTLQINSPALGGPKDAQVAQTAVGTNPTLTWIAPATGTPDLYRVTMMKKNAGATPDVALATFETTETQLVVPPVVLTVGAPVYFIVRAQQKVGPIVAGTPQGWADTFTDIITP